MQSCKIDQKNPSCIDVLLPKMHLFSTLSLSDFIKIIVAVIKMHFTKMKLRLINYCKYKTFHVETLLTVFRMGVFGTAHGWPKRSSSSKSVKQILQGWNFAQLYLSQRRSKKYTDHMTHPLSSAGISILDRKSATSVISKNTDIDRILMYNL